MSAPRLDDEQSTPLAPYLNLPTHIRRRATARCRGPVVAKAIQWELPLARALDFWEFQVQCHLERN